MMSDIHIDGIVETDISHDEWLDQFIKWIEENGWTFGGITEEQEDG
jgi:hypothetical protein